MRVGKTTSESLTKFEITQEFLKNRFHYEPNTGCLTYLQNQPPFGIKGASATFFNHSIRAYQVSIKGRGFPASRLIWLYVLGELPSCQIMFRDGNPKNLKWDNLVKISDNPTHLPTQQELRTLLHYDLLSGLCTWQYIPYYIRRAKVGDNFGCLARHVATKTQSRIGAINGHHKQLTHFIWCYMTGEYPKKGVYIDHKDRNPLNNAWDNLRLASAQENSSNQSNRKNTNLLRGVERVNKTDRYYARCMFKGKRYTCPHVRDTQEEAHQDYIELHKRLHGEFSNYVDEVKT